MIKAEAYGHGMAGIARAAERAGVSMLGFASLSEALALNDKRGGGGVGLILCCRGFAA